MAAWEVRDARPRDAPVLGWIHVESWRAAYRGIVPDAVLEGLDAGRRGRDWLRWIDETPPGHLLVIERTDDGALLGFAGVGTYRPNPDADHDLLADAGIGELYLFYLDPEVWGSGAATDLAVAVDDALAALGFRQAALWVFEANGRARRFYERHGWLDDGTRVGLEIGGIVVPEARHVRELDGPAPL